MCTWQHSNTEAIHSAGRELEVLCVRADLVQVSCGTPSANPRYSGLPMSVRTPYSKVKQKLLVSTEHLLESSAILLALNYYFPFYFPLKETINTMIVTLIIYV